MPVCKVCMKRIDVSKTGTTAHRCRLCGSSACRAHYDIVRMVCHKCMGIPPKKRSYVRT